MEMAEQLAALDPQVFALTKRYLRAPALERMANSAEHDRQALALWAAPATHARIRDYLARSVRR
jgi:hypothetical protein